MKQFFVRAAVIATVTLATTSCSWLESLDADPTLDWSADKLYTEARAALDDSNWTQAKEYYQKLEARYPFGQYAQQAQIEAIYANWKDGSADLAVQGADRFLKAYPNHANSDYVLYLKALATLNENDSLIKWLLPENMNERDANAAREAFDTFKELVLRFPQSRYAPEARRRMHQLVIAQAEHELQTAKYYYDRSAYVAAIERAQRVVREFQNTPQRDDALFLIRDSYKALGMNDLEKDTERLIELNKAQRTAKTITVKEYKPRRSPPTEPPAMP